MKKVKKWVKIGVLFLIFLAAVVASSLIINRGTDDQTISLGEPTLPEVSFVVEEHTVNPLVGYVNEMDVTAMRDTITPVAATRTLQMNIASYGEEITGIEYEAYSLNGEQCYLKETVEDWNQNGAAVTEDAADESNVDAKATLNLSKALDDSIPEAVLKVTLQLGDKNVYYYTRIEQSSERSVKECLNFAEDFHTKTFDRQYAEELGQYLEPNEESDNTTLQTVNIHSDISHLQWGELNPAISTDVEWSIKECNTVYTSILARYQVTYTGDSGDVETYNVREFFRVRYGNGRMYLLDYSRSMNQVFNGNKHVVDKDGLLLGLAEADIPYETNKKGTVLSFVQERDLWTYNQESDELSLVFSFANMEGHDARSRNDEHAVRIISVDSAGNTAFAVYGYMNRGEYEGQVGVDVYYFNIAENAVEEKAFIPSTKSFAIAEDELGKMVYFNEEQQMLYALAGGTLYQVALENDEQVILAENLEEGEYVVSDDGHMLAFRAGADGSESKIQVLNLSTGESYDVNAGEGENVYPMGFVSDDFICGYAKADDIGTNATGEELRPMYQLEIRNPSNEVVKTYAQEGIYLTDVLVDSNLVTLNRVAKNGDSYTGVSQDYITNNEERKESNVTLETFSTDLKERQMRFTFAGGIEETSPKILRPKQVMAEKPITISFDDKVKPDKYYVYGMGELVAVYDKAAYAIQKAAQVSGVVISSEQSYIWEKGNRDLVYATGAEAFKKADDQTSLDACTAFMERYDAKRIDLTGCTLDQILYIINKGRPVIAMTDADHAILLTGYTTEDVTYINPDTGEQSTVSIDTMNAMVAGSGNTFIGYVK